MQVPALPALLSFVTFASSCVTLASCAPVPEADAPLDEDERPCRTHDDCEVRAADKGPRSMLCGQRAVAWGSQPAKDAAACGPMPSMTPNLPEPQLLCFRGTCVPVGKDR
jgi:hypothetical protein